MPFSSDIPSIDDFRKAFGDAIIGEKDNRIDVRPGSIWDHIAGSCAIMWSRELQKDNDRFSSIFLYSATGDELTDLLEQRFPGFTRQLDTYGQGTCTFVRPTVAAGAGTIWKGTRILLNALYTKPRYYEVATDTYVAANQYNVSVPIQATFYGPSSFVDSNTNNSFKFDDPLWDNTWVPASFTCKAGTFFEAAEEAIARAKKEQIDNRYGFKPRIVKSCTDVGAVNVVLFESNYGGSSLDHGLNVCYVGDSSYQTTTSLLNSCKIAVDSSRNAGDSMQVLPMQSSGLDIDADVYLWDYTTKFDLNKITAILEASITRYFQGQDNGFFYNLDGMSGQMMSSVSAVQYVTFNTPAASVSLLTNNNFPSTLTHYYVNSMNFNYKNPL